jgi:ParB family chromosome partitioning protein
MTMTALSNTITKTDANSGHANAVRVEIDERMKRAGLGVTALAKHAGISQGGFCDFMNSKADTLTLKNLGAVAAALGATIGELLGEGAAKRLSRVTLRHGDIRSNPDNPRKLFDADALAGLAASIEARGLLVPLSVTTDGVLIDGERRWRVIGNLIAAGTWAADREIPVFLGSGQLIGDTSIDSLVANLQREDLAPLEEARAMATLIADHDWTTAAIAVAAGTSQRHVQLRLDLVERLVPDAQAALEAGFLKLSHARALTAAPPEAQKFALPEITAGSYGWRDAEQIKRSLFEDMVPVGRNLFKLEAWPGEIITDPDNAKLQYFPDKALFLKLQREAAQAVKTLLENAGYKWVDFTDHTDPKNTGRDYDEYERDGRRKPEWCGAVVILQRDLQVEIRKGLFLADGEDADQVPENVKVAGEAKAAGEKRAAAKQPAKVTQAHMIACRQAKTRALQAGIAARPDLALRAAVLGLIASGSSICLSRDQIHRDDRSGQKMLDGLVKPYAEQFKSLRGHFPDRVLEIDGWADGKHAKAWAILCGMADDDVAALHAILIAELCGTWNGGNSGLGDGPLARAMAETLGVDMAEHFTLDDDFLATCGKPQLLAILAASAVPGELKKNAKVSELAASVLGDVKAGALEGYVPPAVLFESEKAIAAKMPKKGS